MTPNQITIDGLYSHLENLFRVCRDVRQLQKEYFSKRNQLPKEEIKQLLADAFKAEKELDIWLIEYHNFFTKVPPPDPIEYTKLQIKINQFHKQASAFK